jgi:hypothetical protein
MKYYQYDDNALYIGSGDALPGDVPNSWIYPHNITSVAPPTDEPGKWKWGGDVWRAVTPEELEAAFSALVTARLNAFAALKQYDDITSARLAALSSEFTADGQAAQAAYDATWTAAIALMPQVRNGELTPEQAVEQLPALAWPVS